MPCSTARLASWIWLTSHLARYRLLWMGQRPARMRGRKAQRMAADSSTVARMNTRLAGSASTKNLSRRRPKAWMALMSPSSSSGRTEICGTSSQSIAMKVGNTGMKNSTATASAPSTNTASSPACRRALTGGRAGRLVGSNGPRARAGEPCHTSRAGTRWPAARADWPSTWPQSPMAVSPSITT